MMRIHNAMSQTVTIRQTHAMLKINDERTVQYVGYFTNNITIDDGSNKTYK